MSTENWIVIGFFLAIAVSHLAGIMLYLLPSMFRKELGRGTVKK